MTGGGAEVGTAGGGAEVGMTGGAEVIIAGADVITGSATDEGIEGAIGGLLAEEVGTALISLATPTDVLGAAQSGLAVSVIHSVIQVGFAVA